MPHINVVEIDGEHEVWLDESDAACDFGGVLIGQGVTREVAIRSAQEENQRVGRQLDEMLRLHLQGREEPA